MKRLLFLLSFIFVFMLAACSDGDISINKAADHQTVTADLADKQDLPDIENGRKSDDKAADKESSAAGKDETSDEEPAEENKDSHYETAPLNELHVHFIDAGQADATLLQYSDDENDYTILFDAGDWRGNEVTAYLTKQNVASIDLVIISHPDADHIGQLEQVMNVFSVGEVWMSGNESSTQTFLRAAEAVLESDADYYEPRAGETFDIGPMSLEVIYPDSISGKSNEESIAALFTYGSVKLLFTGDADVNAESWMQSSFNVDADILHLGHHGSSTSNSPAFIEAVSPSIAVYSAGSGNSYNHPDEAVVSNIKNSGIELYGTDVNGNIILTSDGETFEVKTESDGTPGHAAKSKQSQKGSETANSDTAAQAENDSGLTDRAAQSGCIDINSASSDDVQQIIHIGPERAADLIELRPFASVADLTRINGIGPARIADIKTEGKACVQ